MIKGKTPEEIRKTFNIKNDFTEEEEAQVPKRTSGVKRSEVLCLHCNTRRVVPNASCTALFIIVNIRTVDKRSLVLTACVVPVQI